MLGLSDSSWGAWILNAGDRPIGLALVRAQNQPVHVLNSFFSSSPHGAVDSACNSLAPRSTPNPGTWTVAFQDANIAAAQFWPKLAARLDPD